jgi:hypothetical protein
MHIARSPGAYPVQAGNVYTPTTVPHAGHSAAGGGFFAAPFFAFLLGITRNFFIALKIFFCYFPQ